MGLKFWIIETIRLTLAIACFIAWSWFFLMASVVVS